MKYAELRAENAALRDAHAQAMALVLNHEGRIEKLTDALETLVDVQNGPPLVKYADEWEAAMSAAYTLLGRERLDIDTSYQETGG